MQYDGSPYPRDFVIDQNGIIAYANNEIDTEWMISVIYDLINENNGKNETKTSFKITDLGGISSLGGLGATDGLK